MINHDWMSEIHFCIYPEMLFIDDILISLHLVLQISFLLVPSSWFRSLFVLSIRLTLIKTHHESAVEQNRTQMQSDKTNSIPHRRPFFIFPLLRFSSEKLRKSIKMMTDRACIIRSYTDIQLYREMKWKMWPHYASASEGRSRERRNISECHTRMKSIIIAFCVVYERTY